MVVWLAAKSVFLLEYEEEGEQEEQEEEKKVMEKAMRQGMRMSPSNDKSVLTLSQNFLQRQTVPLDKYQIRIPNMI